MKAYRSPTQRRASARRGEQMKWTALVLLVGAFIIGMPVLFSAMDCRTATRMLAYMEQCTASANCTLSARELQRFKAYSKMQILRCD